MRSAHIRHLAVQSAHSPSPGPAGSMSLIRGSAAAAADLTPIPRSSRGERWSAKRRPGRWALKRRSRTGGRMPRSSRTGMSGEGWRACSMPDGPGRARRRWCAARAPWTFVTRSVWRRSAGNQLGPRGTFCRALAARVRIRPWRTPAFVLGVARYSVRCSAFRRALPNHIRTS